MAWRAVTALSTPACCAGAWRCSSARCWLFLVNLGALGHDTHEAPLGTQPALGAQGLPGRYAACWSLSHLPCAPDSCNQSQDAAGATWHFSRACRCGLVLLVMPLTRPSARLPATSAFIVPAKGRCSPGSQGLDSLGWGHSEGPSTPFTTRGSAWLSLGGAAQPLAASSVGLRRDSALGACSAVASAAGQGPSSRIGDDLL